MNGLVKSKWQPLRDASHTYLAPALLDYLGIPYAGGRRYFWLTNKYRLESLLGKLKKKARTMKRDLHPDKGGDAHEFDAFVQVVKVAERQFGFHLPIVESSFQPDMPSTPASSRKSWGRRGLPSLRREHLKFSPPPTRPYNPMSIKRLLQIQAKYPIAALLLCFAGSMFAQTPTPTPTATPLPVVIAWSLCNPIYRVTNYKVYEIIGVNDVLLATLPATDATFSTPATNLSQRIFVVTSVNAIKESPKSNQAIWPLNPPPPGGVVIAR